MWGQIAQAAASTTNAAMGLMGGIFQNRKNRKFQAEQAELNRKFAREMAEQQNQWEQDRMALQFGYNKQAADYSQQLNKEMWEYTGYGNQKRQMEDANLNPALMYGQGGGGGQSASGANMQGATAIAPMGLQVALQAEQMRAQTQLIQAQTAKVESDTTLQNATKFGESFIQMAAVIQQMAIGEKQKDKLSAEVKQIGKTIEEIEANTGVLKENQKLLNFQNRINSLLENAVHVDNKGNSRTFASATIEKWFTEQGAAIEEADKRALEALNDRKVLEKLANDIDKIYQGKINEIEIAGKSLEKLKEEISSIKFENDQNQAVSKLINDLTGKEESGDYARILGSIIRLMIHIVK